MKKQILIGSAMGVGIGKTIAAIIGETPLVIVICVGISVGLSIALLYQIMPNDE